VPFEISEDLSPELVAIAWMVGRWEGTGKGSYPGTEDFDFGQQIDFAHNGGDYLHYLSQTFEVDEQGLAIRPLTMETGFWRPQRDGSIEVVMCHPDGYAEVWYGKITGARIQLATDAVVRTASADDYAAGQRLYGNVEGELLWTFDRAANGQPLQSYIWARLQRA
jgi:THAP4-like, heme-binding beta-barrel domain